MTEKRVCNKCKEEKDLEEFYLRNLKEKYRRRTCKSCDSRMRKDWYHNKPGVRERTLKKNLRLYLERTYGISESQYHEMVKSQDNRCYICGSEETRQRLSVDHCHTTGKIRKLLCQPCNATLGLVKENKHTLLKMINYLEEFNE